MSAALGTCSCSHAADLLRPPGEAVCALLLGAGVWTLWPFSFLLSQKLHPLRGRLLRQSQSCRLPEHDTRYLCRWPGAGGAAHTMAPKSSPWQRSPAWDQQPYEASVSEFIHPRKSFSVCSVQGLRSANSRAMKAGTASRPCALEIIPVPRNEILAVPCRNARATAMRKQSCLCVLCSRFLFELLTRTHGNGSEGLGEPPKPRW